MTRNIIIFVVLFAITLAAIQSAVASAGASLADQRMWPLFIVVLGVPAYITWRLNGILANRTRERGMVFPFGKKQKSAAQEAREERLRRCKADAGKGDDNPPPA